MKRAMFVVSALMLVALAAPAVAQDAAKVDSKHYKVEFENAQARVLHVTYGPHEKSVMHSHPNAIAVFLTDAKVTFTLPGGKTQDATMKAGDAKWTPAGTHLPENTSDKPLELVLIELKGPAKAAKTAKATGKK
jgi:quercetin dioxygenase-like cupin family protein